MTRHQHKTHRATTRCPCGRTLRAKESRGITFAGLIGCVHKGR